jgi:hypothetical protein
VAIKGKAASPARTSVSPEERAEFLALFEENTAPLSAYRLATVQGRSGFLYRFSEKGEGAIFEAVQEVWAQLNEPKSYYCAKMAKSAGLQGGGKTALRAVLMGFLKNFNSIEFKPLADHLDFPTMAEWHVAVSANLAETDAAINILIDKWERILSGQHTNRPIHLYPRREFL